MWSRFSRVSLAAVAVLSLAGTAHAAPFTWNNGGPDLSQFGSGSELGEFEQADDFNVTNTINLLTARFWTLEAVDGSSLTNGTVTWGIFTDGGGTPPQPCCGGGVAFGSSALTRVNTGNLSQGYQVWQNDITFSAVQLTAGTYWFGLENTAFIGQFSDWYWATAALNATNTLTNRGYERDIPFTNLWAPNGYEHAFIINGETVEQAVVPEPATLTLLGLGLVGLAVRRARR